MAIRDLARNVLDPTHNTASFLGYRPTVDEDFPYDLYRMIIKPIRDEDQLRGAGFLQRFLTGPQIDFGRTYATIKSITKLWSYLDCPDELLWHLAATVGFTGDPATAHITDNLTELEMRRLIGGAIPIWKRKGTEQAYAKIAEICNSRHYRIDNWFYYRWIAIEEGVVGEDLDGLDPWLINETGDVVEPDEYMTDITMMDEGRINHTLVRNLMSEVRPTSERLNLIYVDYLDQFLDDILVSTPLGSSEVTDGELVHLEDNTITLASVEGASEWTNVFAMWRAKVAAQTMGDILNKFRLLFNYLDADNYAYIEVNCGAGTGEATVTLGRRVGGTDSVVLGTVTNVPCDFNAYYVWRMQCLLYEDPNTGVDKIQYKVMQDQNPLILASESVTASVRTKGMIGARSYKARVAFDECEAYQMVEV